LRLHHRLSLADARARGLQNALESFGHAILGLDPLRKVIFASRQAEELAREGDGLKLVAERLVAELPDDNAQLQAHSIPQRI